MSNRLRTGLLTTSTSATGLAFALVIRPLWPPESLLVGQVLLFLLTLVQLGFVAQATAPSTPTPPSTPQEHHE